MSSTQSALVVPSKESPLQKITRSIPVPKEKQLLIKVTVAGCTPFNLISNLVNPHEQKNRDTGLFIGDNYPAILGDDIAGIVAKLGPGVTEFKLGDKVFGHSDVFEHLDTGGLQEYCILDEDYTAHLPHNISDDEAASFPVNGLTAFFAMFSDDGYQLPLPSSGEPSPVSNESIVIIGGGANTGKYGIQFARLAGFRKIIAIASPSNESELKRLGATNIIDRHLSESEIKSQIHEILGGDKLLYVYDVVSWKYNFAIHLLSNEKKGTVCTLHFVHIDDESFEEKKDGYRISMILGRSHNKPELSKYMWRALPGWFEEGKIAPLKYHVLKGLDAEGVNRVLDDYRDDKNPGQWHIHPQE
jgi:NADPH:quinone reductase